MRFTVEKWIQALSANLPPKRIIYSDAMLPLRKNPNLIKKTTVIFVDTDQRFKKPISIPTFFLDYWKFISFSVVLFLGLGIYTFIMIGKLYFIQQKNELQAQNEQIKTFSQELTKQYDFITRQITEVNKLLESKGIPKPNQKSEVIIPKFSSPLEMGDNTEFEKYLEEFKRTISNTPFGSPLEGRITSSFGIRSNPFSGENRESHRGIDISAVHGSPVRCTADGKVVFARNKGDYGKLVIINHGDEYETHYGHLSEILVKEGQEVKANTFIGKVGSTGRSSGPHLHYEIHKNDKKINPKTFINLN
jgi:murein DD-endopeptidase MepM/ murein hydrolase activator NlpD